MIPNDPLLVPSRGFPNDLHIYTRTYWHLSRHLSGLLYPAQNRHIPWVPVETHLILQKIVLRHMLSLSPSLSSRRPYRDQEDSRSLTREEISLKFFRKFPQVTLRDSAHSAEPLKTPLMLGRVKFFPKNFSQKFWMMMKMMKMR